MSPRATRALTRNAVRLPGVQRREDRILRQQQQRLRNQARRYQGLITWLLEQFGQQMQLALGLYDEAAFAWSAFNVCSEELRHTGQDLLVAQENCTDTHNRLVVEQQRSMILKANLAKAQDKNTQDPAVDDLVGTLGLNDAIVKPLSDEDHAAILGLAARLQSDANGEPTSRFEDKLNNATVVFLD